MCLNSSPPPETGRGVYFLKVKQKEYEKWFKEKFGVEPFTAEEEREIKAMLFDAGQSLHVLGNVNRFARYQIAYMEQEQRDNKARMEDEDMEELASYAH